MNEHCRTEDLGPPEHCGTEDVCAWARTRTDSSSARGLVALSQGRLQAEPGGQGGQARALRVLGSWGRGCTGAHSPFSGNIFVTSTWLIKRYGTENVQRPCRGSLQGPKFCKPDPLLHRAAWEKLGSEWPGQAPGAFIILCHHHRSQRPHGNVPEHSEQERSSKRLGCVPEPIPPTWAGWSHQELEGFSKVDVSFSGRRVELG